jgi:hypothetical protein
VIVLGRASELVDLVSMPSFDVSLVSRNFFIERTRESAILVSGGFISDMTGTSTAAKETSG